MASWELECPNCKNKFFYMKIADDLVGFYLAPKPIFPEGGLELECPNCGFKVVYQRYSLTYSSTKQLK
jgi:DNA-directed RNA polymerase subunit RPC12/RpoP